MLRIIQTGNSIESGIFPLESGDRLTRDEFERRYHAMPHVKKAELVEGIVHMPSPVRAQRHGLPTQIIGTWLGNYHAATPGVLSFGDTTVRLDMDNEPQPDALMLIEPELGGSAKISDDDYLEGPPELIVEVAASSASYDLGDKKNAYRRNGVQEYIAWRVLEGEIDWFVNRSSGYELLAVDDQRRYQSETFPGLWLDIDAMLRGDLTKVLAVLQEGIGSDEHARFAKELADRRA